MVSGCNNISNQQSTINKHHLTQHTQQQQHNNNTTTTTQQQHNNNTTTQQQHNNNTTTTQQQHNNNTGDLHRRNDQHPLDACRRGLHRRIILGRLRRRSPRANLPLRGEPLRANLLRLLQPLDRFLGQGGRYQELHERVLDS